jgi:hypothetical protein
MLISRGQASPGNFGLGLVLKHAKSCPSSDAELNAYTVPVREAEFEISLTRTIVIILPDSFALNCYS